MVSGSPNHVCVRMFLPCSIHCVSICQLTGDHTAYFLDIRNKCGQSISPVVTHSLC